MDISEVYKAINTNAQVRDLVKTAPLSIVERMQVKRYENKQFVLQQGETYPNTYLLVAGQVKVFLNSPSGK